MRVWTLLTVICLLLGHGAAAQQRIALVVGNSEYAAVTPLDNAASDAELMADALLGVGFEVTLLRDATQISFQRAVAQFGRELRAGGPETVGLFYYAGHGVHRQHRHWRHT